MKIPFRAGRQAGRQAVREPAGRWEGDKDGRGLSAPCERRRVGLR